MYARLSSIEKNGSYDYVDFKKKTTEKLEYLMKIDASESVFRKGRFLIISQAVAFVMAAFAVWLGIKD